MGKGFELLSTGPARILKLDSGCFKTGKPADLVQIDPNAACVIDTRHLNLFHASPLLTVNLVRQS